MSEIVVIRLGSQARDPIPWLVWDPAGDEVIASGVLPGAAHLNQLHQRAGGRPLHVLVSAADLAFRQVTVPGRLTRQSLKALPYLLEEELGSDVESLHLVLLGQQGQQVDLVAVEQGRMAMWLDWLEEAGLQPRSLLPDVLCLPWQAERWSALPLAGQWLFRNGPCTGMVVEPAWLDPLLVRIEPAPQIASYGPVPEGAPGEWQAEPPVLAMQLLAAGVLGVITSYSIHYTKLYDMPSRKWVVTASLTNTLPSRTRRMARRCGYPIGKDMPITNCKRTLSR